MADLSNQYNTALSAQDEAKFQQWARANNRSGDVYDYDLRGAFKSGAAQAENGHLPDTFKKPNHPTFSTESQYSGKDGNVGGVWSQDVNGRDVFTPSPTNLSNTTPDALRSYFKKVEPDATVSIPASADQAVGYDSAK